MSKKIIIRLVNFIVIVLLTPILGFNLIELSKALGVKPVRVEVAGTGSMYPSLYWSSSEGGPEKPEAGVEEYRSSPFMYKARLGKTKYSYGDMVAFSNQQTADILAKEGKSNSTGFIKRIIGMPGDTIEVRDGYVLRNNQIIDEPYIYAPRSTYGGKFLPDCKPLKLAENNYFVMGDNRKASSDSRHDLGLISEGDILYTLPLSKQAIYHSLWRDSSKDQERLGLPTIIQTDLYASFSTLNVDEKLAKSALLRAEALLKDVNTTYDLKKSIRDANYKNIVVGEFVTFGHYTAEELLQNLKSNYETSRELANPDYDEIGISVVNKIVDGCPTQVIVGHLGGYIPATYATDIIKSWESAKTSLEAAISSWEKAVGHPKIDQAKLTELLSLYRSRLELVNLVLSTMQKREWFSDSLESKVALDEQIATRAENLAKELNGD